MSVIYHRLVQRDVNEIRRYYEEEAGATLADEFFDELMTFINRAAERPTRYHPASSLLRRVNLERFPFHVLYAIQEHGIFVVVVRHNRRHPSYGLKRR